jgi:hypothetical protein
MSSFRTHFLFCCFRQSDFTDYFALTADDLRIFYLLIHSFTRACRTVGYTAHARALVLSHASDLLHFATRRATQCQHVDDWLIW